MRHMRILSIKKIRREIVENGIGEPVASLYIYQGNAQWDGYLRS